MKHKKIQDGKSNYFTIISRYSSCVLKNKPGTGSNNYTAFYGVLQNRLLIFLLVPRVSSLHDYAALKSTVEVASSTGKHKA